MDAKAGKLLLLAACLGCLSPALTIAACLSHRTPFATDLNSQDRASKAQAALAASGTLRHVTHCLTVNRAGHKQSMGGLSHRTPFTTDLNSQDRAKPSSSGSLLQGSPAHVLALHHMVTPHGQPCACRTDAYPLSQCWAAS